MGPSAVGGDRILPAYEEPRSSCPIGLPQQGNAVVTVLAEPDGSGEQNHRPEHECGQTPRVWLVEWPVEHELGGRVLSGLDASIQPE